jgi:hypothetical protein
MSNVSLYFQDMSRSAAELFYDKLSGLACLFKPADMQLTHFIQLVQQRLATGRYTHTVIYISRLNASLMEN